MKKAFYKTGCIITLSIVSINVQASLVNGSTLSIESGSYFNFVNIGQLPVTGIDGVILGSTQAYDFTISGNRIDDFMFLGSPGMHYTTSPTDVLSASGNSATIDFSGWSWAFNGAAASFNLGSGAWGSNPDGIAEITCNIDCGNGDTYSLLYTATVSEDDPNGYAGFEYELRLTGTVSAVPLPASIWLFGSALLGLFAVVRRNSKSKSHTCV